MIPVNESPAEDPEIRVLHVDDEPRWYELADTFLEDICETITVWGSNAPR